MKLCRRFGLLAAAALTGAVLSSSALAKPATPASTLKLIECQHPLITGEEVFNLKNVTAATACPVVLDLGHWEQIRGNIPKLYRCAGPGKHTPVLKLHTFEGWSLAITNAGFQMSRGHSSFDVGGTDFPVSCF